MRGKDRDNFYVPVLTFLTLVSVVVLVLLVSWINSWTLCDSTKCTIQEWLAATSGWVGFAAAAVGAYFVLGQLKEQRRQSEFLVGDTDPEFILLRNRKNNSIALRTVNWNRSGIMIERVTCVEPPNTMISSVRDVEKTPNPKAITGNHPTFLVEGWPSRSGNPPSRRLELTFSRGDRKPTNLDMAGHRISIEVSYRIIGQIHERRKSISTALDIEEH
jgi:hypothetical protein